MRVDWTDGYVMEQGVWLLGGHLPVMGFGLVQVEKTTSTMSIVFSKQVSIILTLQAESSIFKQFGQTILVFGLTPFPFAFTYFILQPTNIRIEEKKILD